MNLNKENIKKIRGLIIFTILILVAVSNYTMLWGVLKFWGHVLFPFALGGALAFVLNVPMNFIETNMFGKSKRDGKKWAKKLARPLSFLLSLLFVIGIIVLVIFVVTPELVDTIINLGKNLQAFIPEVRDWAIQIFHDNPEMVEWIHETEFKWDEILANGISFFQRGAENLIGSTFSIVKNVINGMMRFVIAFVFACYILLQKERLRIQISKVVYAFLPKDWAEIIFALSSVTYKTFSNFVTGQCLEAIILGTMFFITMSILRMPYALLIGVLIAFTALIPLFGAFIGCALGAVLIFVVNPLQAIGFVALFLVLQQIEGNLIYPHVVGNSIGLPSIWVLVAVSVGASLMGVVGMLIFIPIVSVIYTLFRGIVNRRLKEKDIKVK